MTRFDNGEYPEITGKDWKKKAKVAIAENTGLLIDGVPHEIGVGRDTSDMINLRKEILEIVTSTCNRKEGKCSICKNQTRRILYKFKDIVDLLLPEGCEGELKSIRGQLLSVLR